MDMEIGHSEDRDHAQILLILCPMKFFSYLFPNTLIMNFQQETIAFWRKKMGRRLL